MDKNIENINDEVTTDKKKIKNTIIKFVSIFAGCTVGLCLVVGVLLFNIIKSNVNYTEAQAKEIALEQVPGQVVHISKDLDIDHLTLDYEIKIKDKNNIIREITVDSKFGAISEFENYRDHD